MSNHGPYRINYTTGICALSICPVRKKPEEESEMISQLLFGEQCTVLELHGSSWVKIRCNKDGYEGWADTKLIEECHKPYTDHDKELFYCLESNYAIMAGEDSRLITFGAVLPFYDGMSFRLNGTKYSFSGQAARCKDLPLTEVLVEKLCRKYLNAPYLWGGKTPFGVDCSGFVQMIFRVLGVELPRDAKDQAREGMTVDFVSESMTGDIAYFTKKTNRISHVGIILDDNQLIHASGKVRIDTLDHQGIFNADENRYTHQLKIIKRVL